jgi:hypothetical protein
VEQQQAAQLHSNFGIGIEREIYSQPYFSYHYGYKSLLQMPERNSCSKLFEVEKKVKEKFKTINFHILFLNISRRGTFVNFTLKDQENYDEIQKLGIIPIKNQNSFTFNLDDIGGDIPHREIFPKANLDEFDITYKTLNVTKEVISKFNPIFYCIGFDGCNGKLNYDTIHLELYPQHNIGGSKDFINILKTYGINTTPFEKYFLNFKRFSHVKFKVESGEIKNIKYYRSLNVNIPEFYYG